MERLSSSSLSYSASKNDQTSIYSSKASRIFRERYVFHFEPFNRKGLFATNISLFRIFAEELDTNETFIPFAEKEEGMNFGTLYRTNESSAKWLGKIAPPPTSVSISSEKVLKEINFGAVKEMLGYNLYLEFGRNFFRLPKTLLANLPIKDSFTQNKVGNIYYGLERCLRIMTEYLQDFTPFAQVTTWDHQENRAIPCLKYIEEYRRFPTTVLFQGKSVPLHGMIELITVMHVLCDSDGLGGSGKNAGIIWERGESNNVIAARATKIDPGEVFSFDMYPLHETSKDVFLAATNGNLFIEWDAISRDPEAKQRFIGALIHCLKYKDDDAMLDFIFYRRFKRDSNAQEIDLSEAQTLVDKLKQRLEHLSVIYKENIKECMIFNPEELFETAVRRALVHVYKTNPMIVMIDLLREKISLSPIQSSILTYLCVMQIIGKPIMLLMILVFLQRSGIIEFEYFGKTYYALLALWMIYKREVYFSPLARSELEAANEFVSYATSDQLDGVIRLLGLNLFWTDVFTRQMVAERLLVLPALFKHGILKKPYPCHPDANLSLRTLCKITEIARPEQIAKVIKIILIYRNKNYTETRDLVNSLLNKVSPADYLSCFSFPDWKKYIPIFFSHVLLAQFSVHFKRTKYDEYCLSLEKANYPFEKQYLSEEQYHLMQNQFKNMKKDNKFTIPFEDADIEIIDLKKILQL